MIYNKNRTVFSYGNKIGLNIMKSKHLNHTAKALNLRLRIKQELTFSLLRAAKMIQRWAARSWWSW